MSEEMTIAREIPQGRIHPDKRRFVMNSDPGLLERGEHCRFQLM